MAGKISNFTINRLHGRFSVSIPFQDNKLVLVGENGLGKSTIVNILFYCLSRQWFRLAEFIFDSIDLIIDNYPISIPYSAVKEFCDSEREMVGVERYRSMIQRWLESHGLDAADLLIPGGQRDFNSLNREMPLPTHHVRYLLEVLASSPDKMRGLAVASSLLQQHFTSQILYLPTYRRIEKELKAIYPEFEEKLREYRRKEVGSSTSSYLELVEFGMEDVNTLVNRTMARLKDEFRSALEQLTAEYLRDVLRKEYESLQYSPIGPDGEEELAEVLSRIDEQLLTKADRLMLTRMVHEMIDGKSEKKDLVVAHFLRKLLNLHRNQTSREQHVRTKREITSFGTAA